MSDVLLEVTDLVVYHGQLCAVDEVSFRIEEGEVFAIIGANGAGKSTLLRSIAGLHKLTRGSIVFKGRDLHGLAPHRRVALGMSLVPEGRRLFSSLTLEENFQVGRRRWQEGHLYPRQDLRIVRLDARASSSIRLAVFGR